MIETRPLGVTQSDSKNSPADKVVKKNATDAPQPDSFRELVEAIAVAFILAFVFKTFLAEAFIIPTGSMAPTLQGRHNDIYCEKCGYEYRTGAPEDRDNNVPLTCPNCNYSFKLDIPENLNHQTFPGDKILVNKFIYDFSEPQRFDVIVFKFPEDSKTNYIKRLVGLPGEILKITHGDIFVSTSTDKPLMIARKPNATKMRAMLQDVYDHDHLSAELAPNAESLRWQDWSGSQAAHHWQPSEDKKSFTLASPNSETTWLRYQHLVPTQDWNDEDKKPAPIPPPPSLIKDHYAYNLGPRDAAHNNAYSYVGDLALECNVQADKGNGSLTFELIAGGRQFHAIADLASGEVVLKIPALPDFKVTSKTKPFADGRNHKVLFANVDAKLWLVVDGTEIDFDKEAIYDLPYVEGSDLVKTRPGQTVASDLSPVGIGAQGTKNAKVEHLRIMRDVYYTTMNDGNSNFINTSHSEAHLLKDEKKPLNDQFFMCGDNSPNSLDSRLWPQQFFVERRNLIGKATYVFWPHSWPTGISKKFDLSLFSIDIPFWPNFSRMRLIR